MSEKSLSFYELECLLGEFIESKGFTLHSSIFTASKVSKIEGYRYSLVVSKSQEEPSVEEGQVSGDAIKQLHAVIRKYWCDEFEHGESCKHCTLEFKICIPLLKLMYPEFEEEARGIKKSNWKELWKEEDVEDREEWLYRVKAEGDNLKNKADLFDSNLILINQFAILKGKHYWRGDELEEMKNKAEKYDDIIVQYGIVADHCLTAEGIILEIEGTKLLKKQWDAEKKLDTIREWMLTEDRENVLSIRQRTELNKILGQEK